MCVTPRANLATFHPNALALSDRTRPRTAAYLAVTRSSVHACPPLQQQPALPACISPRDAPHHTIARRPGRSWPSPPAHCTRMPAHATPACLAPPRPCSFRRHVGIPAAPWSPLGDRVRGCPVRPARSFPRTLGSFPRAFSLFPSRDNSPGLFAGMLLPSPSSLSWPSSPSVQQPPSSPPRPPQLPALPPYPRLRAAR